MGVISIVIGIYKPMYNWGGTTLQDGDNNGDNQTGSLRGDGAFFPMGEQWFNHGI